MPPPEDNDTESETEDAIALFRPRNKAMILPFLDLDDGENEEGIYAEELPDGSFLVHTFQPFELFDENPSEARTWLAQFGIALPEVHDDPRGFLFFPDDIAHEDASSYDDIVKTVDEQGVWIGLGELVDDDEADGEDMEPGEQAALDLQQLVGMMGGGAQGGAPAIDMDMLQKLAGQLMGGAPGAPGAAPGGSFEIGQMFEQMQRGILESMAAQGAEGDSSKGEVVDDEFAPDPAPRKKTTK